MSTSLRITRAGPILSAVLCCASIFRVVTVLSHHRGPSPHVRAALALHRAALTSLGGGLRLRGGFAAHGHDPERAAKRQAMINALRESSLQEQERTPGHSAIAELLRNRAAANLSETLRFNITQDPQVAGPLTVDMTDLAGSDLEEEQNIFVRVPAAVDPVYDEEYAAIRAEALEQVKCSYRVCVSIPVTATDPVRTHRGRRRRLSKFIALHTGLTLGS